MRVPRPIDESSLHGIVVPDTEQSVLNALPFDETRTICWEVRVRRS